MFKRKIPRKVKSQGGTVVPTGNSFFLNTQVSAQLQGPVKMCPVGTSLKHNSRCTVGTGESPPDHCGNTAHTHRARSTPWSTLLQRRGTLLHTKTPRTFFHRCLGSSSQNNAECCTGTVWVIETCIDTLRPEDEAKKQVHPGLFNLQYQSWQTPQL